LGVPGDGSAGSNGTAAAGLYPNPTHPTNNRFNMDDEELFDDNDATTNGGHFGNGSSGQMMSERDPSFLSSAAGSAGGYGGGTGYSGAGAAASAGMAGLGAGVVAASQGSRGHGEYYHSHDGHYSPERSPPHTSYAHGNQSGYSNYDYSGRPGHRNQLSVVNNLGDVGEE